MQIIHSSRQNTSTKKLKHDLSKVLSHIQANWIIFDMSISH